MYLENHMSKPICGYSAIVCRNEKQEKGNQTSPTLVVQAKCRNNGNRHWNVIYWMCVLCVCVWFFMRICVNRAQCFVIDRFIFILRLHWTFSSESYSIWFGERRCSYQTSIYRFTKPIHSLHACSVVHCSVIGCSNAHTTSNELLLRFDLIGFVHCATTMTR